VSSGPFARGKHSLGICDRCGFQFKLADLRQEVTNDRFDGLLVCRSCLDPDHPQLDLGRYKVVDPQALRMPRPDGAYRAQSIQWGWAPVGMVSGAGLPPSTLLLTAELGIVEVVTT
jgi:hypothetical protein